MNLLKPIQTTSSSSIPIIYPNRAIEVKPNLITRQSSTCTATSTSKFSTATRPEQTTPKAAVTTKSATAPPQHQKIVVQASTNDLLRCLVNYLCKHCPHIVVSGSNSRNSPGDTTASASKVDARDIICWLRSADRALLTQGWQDIAFMNPVNVVFVYLLVKEGVRLSHVDSVHDLHRQLMTCLYLAFSYMGNEISYPLKPFLVENDRQVIIFNNLIQTQL